MFCHSCKCALRLIILMALNSYVKGLDYLAKANDFTVAELLSA